MNSVDCEIEIVKECDIERLRLLECSENVKESVKKNENIVLVIV